MFAIAYLSLFILDELVRSQAEPVCELLFTSKSNQASLTVVIMLVRELKKEADVEWPSGLWVSIKAQCLKNAKEKEKERQQFN